MKLLHVIPTLDHRSGGPARAILGLSSALVAQGHDVRVAVAEIDNDDRDLVNAAEAAGVEVIVESGSDWMAEALRWCDVCHIHALWEGILHRAAVAARRVGRPYLIRPCGMLDPWSLAQGKWKKRLYIAWRLRANIDGSRGLHFTTSREAELAVPLGFLAPSIVEPNGVDLEEFTQSDDGPSLRDLVPAIGERRVLLFLSRIHHKKGLDLLIPAFARLADTETVLVIAGPDEGGYKTQVQTMIEREGLGDRVIFTGLLRGADRIVALGQADLFVLPSYQENFGIVVVESLAAGTPVVISDQVNICGEIAEAQVGGVVPLDAERLAGEIDAWLADDAGRRAAGERGRVMAFERFDWRSIATRWTERYQRLAAGKEGDGVISA